MSKIIYLDHASSTPVFLEVLKSYTKLLNEHYANANALHDAGLKLHSMLEESRQSCAKQLGVDASCLTYTSGATEANNLILKGLAFQYQSRGKHLICSAIEHDSVLECMLDLERYFGFECTLLPVDEAGQINELDLKNALRKDTILVSIMSVNNETGVILDVEKLAYIVHQNSTALFHTDAVQALAKHPLNFKCFDAVSLSAHKINGLKGSGLIYLRSGLKVTPLISGAHVDSSIKSGTPNALSDLMFAKTLRLALIKNQLNEKHINTLNHYLRLRLSEIEGCEINSPIEMCSPYILNISVLDLPSQVMLNILSREGIYASAAASCSDRSYKPSHVLKAMGKSAENLKGVIRLSLSADNSVADIDQLIEVMKKGIKDYAR